MKGVIYNGTRLVPGSRALELYECRHEKDGQKKLDEHLKQVDAAARARGELSLEEWRAQLPTGFAALDARGLKPGELMVLCARRAGRSILAGYREGKPVYNLNACTGNKTMLLFQQVHAAIEAGRAYGVLMVEGDVKFYPPEAWK